MANTLTTGNVNSTGAGSAPPIITAPSTAPWLPLSFFFIPTPSPPLSLRSAHQLHSKRSRSSEKVFPFCISPQGAGEEWRWLHSAAAKNVPEAPERLEFHSKVFVIAAFVLRWTVRTC